jgi:hypothetical protein
MRISGIPGRALLAVVTDGIDGATVLSLGAESYLLVRLGLLANVGYALVFISSEEITGYLTAKTTVDAVAVDVELTGNILFVFGVNIGHNVYGA